MTPPTPDREGSGTGISATDVPPPGWDHDLWFQFQSAVTYEQTVPRDFDGEPLFDGDGVQRRSNP